MKEKFINALQDKDFSELFKKGGLSFLIRIGGQVMGFLLTLIIAHYFGAKGLGDYVLSIVVLRIFTLFSKFNVLYTFALLITTKCRCMGGFENVTKCGALVTL